MRSAKANALWPRGRFDALTIVAHWLTAILVTFVGGLGLAIVCLDKPEFMPPLLLLHRSTGVAIWAITLARLLWRRTFSRFPAFPERMSIAQQWLVAATERSLYGLLLLQPLTGMASTIALGRPFALFVWTVPALMPRSLEISLWLAGAHAATAGCLLAVVGVHAARALVHRYFLRDDIFEAMAPWTRKRAKRAAIRELRVVANSREA